MSLRNCFPGALSYCLSVSTEIPVTDAPPPSPADPPLSLSPRPDLPSPAPPAVCQG